jgi:hypothetical protein
VDVHPFFGPQLSIQCLSDRIASGGAIELSQALSKRVEKAVAIHRNAVSVQRRLGVGVPQ